MPARSMCSSGRVEAELARLLPELSPSPEPTVPADTPGSARLYEAVLILLERLASPGGLVLVLEDLQWADVSSRTLLAYLHRNLGPAPVLIAASLRTDALAADDPVLELLRELGRSPVGEQLPLGPLTPTDARAMLRGITDVAGPEDRALAILRRSGGVPLYVEELAATAPGSSDPPVSVRSAVEHKTGRLTREGRQVVGLVALVAARSTLDSSRLPPEWRATDSTTPSGRPSDITS